MAGAQAPNLGVRHFNETGSCGVDKKESKMHGESKLRSLMLSSAPGLHLPAHLGAATTHGHRAGGVQAFRRLRIRHAA